MACQHLSKKQTCIFLLFQVLCPSPMTHRQASWDAHVGFTAALLGKLGSLMCGFHMAHDGQANMQQSIYNWPLSSPGFVTQRHRAGGFWFPSLIYPQPAVLQLWFMDKEAYDHPFMLVQYKIHALDDWTRNIKQFLFVEKPSVSMRSCNSFEVAFWKAHEFSLWEIRGLKRLLPKLQREDSSHDLKETQAFGYSSC